MRSKAIAFDINWVRCPPNSPLRLRYLIDSLSLSSIPTQNGEGNRASFATRFARPPLRERDAKRSGVTYVYGLTISASARTDVPILGVECFVITVIARYMRARA